MRIPQRNNDKYDLCLNKSYPRKRVSSVSSRLDSCFRRNDARLIFAVMIGIYFGFCAVLFGFLDNAYASNLDKIKEYFISGDYKAAISEGEKILADTGNTSSGLDELYYFFRLELYEDGQLPAGGGYI